MQRPSHPRGLKKRKSYNKQGVVKRPRLPTDYPWQVLDRLTTDIAQFIPAEAHERLTRIVRARDSESLYETGANWGLQCMSSVKEQDVLQSTALLGLSSLIRKYPFAGNSDKREQNALSKVREAELQCSRFNRIGYKVLLREEISPIHGRPIPTTHLYHMQHFVCQVLGAFPGPKIRHWSRHGPGGSTQTSRGLVSKYQKYSDWPYHVSSRAISHARCLIQEDERWYGALEESYRKFYDIKSWELLDMDKFWANVLKPHDSNRITTVPKDGLTDRPIAIEPTLNVMLQLGVDGYIRKRLKRWGIDLDSQQKNRYLARKGSMSDDAESPCTLDMSNASDTVSLRICKLLLTPEWFEYLCDLRSPKGTYPSGECARYSKLSSMGNGYTFAMEALVFASVVYAAQMHTYGHWNSDLVSIYGDDIIVPKASVPLTEMLLEACGFTVNQAKSFVEGPVRESCGHDYYFGQLIRPVYMKKQTVSMADIFADRNRIHRWVQLHFGVDTPALDEFLQQYVDTTIVGPYSDEEFASYWHTPVPPDNSFRGWMFHYYALAYRPRQVAGEEFAFRKLQTELRQQPVPKCVNLSAQQLKGVKGSLFDITKRNAGALVQVKRVDTTWCDCYNMLLALAPA